MIRKFIFDIGVNKALNKQKKPFFETKRKITNLKPRVAKPFISKYHTSSRLKYNHYDVLGLKRTASASEIQAAYRQKAKEWHPDMNKDPKAAETFVHIQKAYSVLRNSQKRREYDNILDQVDALAIQVTESSEGMKVVRPSVFSRYRSMFVWVAIGVTLLCLNWWKSNRAAEEAEYVKNPRLYYKSKKEVENEQQTTET